MARHCASLTNQRTDTARPYLHRKVAREIGSLLEVSKYQNEDQIRTFLIDICAHFIGDQHSVIHGFAIAPTEKACHVCEHKVPNSIIQCLSAPIRYKIFTCSAIISFLVR